MHQHSMSTPYSLKLCSVDSSGVCVTWDVAMGTVLCEFNIGSKSVVDMKWLHTNVSCMLHFFVLCGEIGSGDSTAYMQLLM